MNESLVLVNRLAEAWWLQVLHGFWQAALVGGVLLLVVGCCGRLSASLRYALVMLALLKFLCPPMLSAPSGVFSRWHSIESAAAPSAGEPATIEPAAAPAASDFRSTATPVASSAAASAITMPRASRPSLSWKAVLMLVHLSGTALLLAALLRQASGLGRLMRESKPCREPSIEIWFVARARQLGCIRPIALRVSPTVDSPIAFGARRPTIVLPANVLELPRQDVETVLMHELAHVRRGDPWMVWLQALAAAVWWFHPLVWITNRTLRRLREECCDDLLLISGVTTCDGYCDTLLRVAAHFPSREAGLACGMAERQHPLGQRLRRIMDPAARRTERLSVGSLLVLVVLSCIVLPGSRQATADPGDMPTPLKHASSLKVESHTTAKIETETSDALAGPWLLKLPAGFEYWVRFEPLSEGRYRLQPPGRTFGGVYQLNGDRLTMVAGDDPRLSSFEFRLDEPGRWRLTSPETAANGGRYVGATLSLSSVSSIARSNQLTDLSGPWRLNLPAGFEHDVELLADGQGRYRLSPGGLMMSGLYEARGDRLVLVEPRAAWNDGFEWQHDGAGGLRLVSQPDPRHVGPDYRGATLKRRP